VLGQKDVISHQAFSRRHPFSEEFAFTRGSPTALPFPSVVVSLRPETQDDSVIAVEPVQAMARTHGSEMV
jgi:hypothetical protein